MRNHRLESRVRENRTHGSEGGEGERSFLPLSVALEPGRWIPGSASRPRNDDSWPGLARQQILPTVRNRCFADLEFVTLDWLH